MLYSLIDRRGPSVWSNRKNAPSILFIPNYLLNPTSLSAKSMRLFEHSEIEDLSLLVNKTSTEIENLSEKEASAVNENLRKNSSYYLNSHIMLLSEKSPTSCFINLRLENENYTDRLEDLLQNLQAPYKIHIDRLRRFDKEF